LAVRGLCPELLAALLEPVVQSIQRWKARRWLPQTMTRVLNVLLDLSLLPAGSRIAELRFEQVVAGYRLETDVDVTLFAAALSIAVRMLS